VKKWNVEYWCESKPKSSVEGWMNALTKDQFKSVAKEIRLLELCGNGLRLPHSRALGNGLFELRERKFAYRIYYTFLRNNTVVLLHAGEKSSRRKAIKTARERYNYLKYS